MNPRPCSGVSNYGIVGMTQTWNVFICPALRRQPDYFISGKKEFRHLDAGRGQKNPQYFGFGDYLSYRPIIPILQFSQLRVVA